MVNSSQPFKTANESVGILLLHGTDRLSLGPQHLSWNLRALEGKGTVVLTSLGSPDKCLGEGKSYNGVLPPTSW